MQTFLNPLLALLLVAMTTSGDASAGTPGAELQDTRLLRSQAADWIEQQAGAAFPGTSAQVQVGRIDPRLRLAECAQPEFFLPAGARLWGGGSVGVRCSAPADWRLYLTYRIQLTGPALVARHPLPARQALSADDVSVALLEYGANPAAYLQTLPSGALIKRPIPAGQAILLESLAMPTVIQAGRKVRIHVTGASFTIAQEGIALNSAKAGEVVRIKTSSGRIVQGMAGQDGEVEIHP